MFGTFAWAAGAALLAVASHFIVEVEHNLMAWSWQGSTTNTAIAVALYGAALVGFYRAGLGAQGRAGPALALLLTLVGMHGLPGYHGDVVKPREPAPVEYRIGRAAMMTLPLVFVGIGLRRRE